MTHTHTHTKYRLQLFQRLDKFRVIIFGGDGSIGWVLSAIDKLHLHSKVIISSCIIFNYYMSQHLNMRLLCIKKFAKIISIRLGTVE